MEHRITSFGLGCGFGALAVTVLRHELPLAQRAPTVAMLATVGAALGALSWTWARRLRTSPDGPGEARPWTVFAWCTGVLWTGYLALVAIVLFA